MSNEKIIELMQHGYDRREGMTQLYEQNKVVIGRICRRLSISLEEYEEALQDAFFGLYNAAQAYEPARGCKFITYATKCIEHAVTRGRHQRGGYGASEATRLKAVELDRLRQRLEQELFRKPSLSEVAAAAGTTPETARRLLLILERPQSLDEPIRTETGEQDTLKDLISDGSDLEAETAERDARKQLQEVTRAAVSQLPDRERRYITLQYLRGQSVKDIAAAEDLSTQAIRLVLNRALGRLKGSDLERDIDMIRGGLTKEEAAAAVEARRLIEAAVDEQTPYYKRGKGRALSGGGSTLEDIALKRMEIAEEVKARAKRIAPRAKKISGAKKS